MSTTPLPPPTEALRQLRDVIPFRLRLAFNSGEIKEGNLRVVRDSAERAASEVEWHHKAYTQARADLEAEVARLREALKNLSDAIEKFTNVSTEDWPELAAARAALESKP